MPNRRIKGHVVQGKNTKHYRGEGPNERYHPYQYSKEFARHQEQDKYRGGHYKRQTTKNPFENLGYMGDKIGVIHIADMIPHMKRKRK